MQSLYVEEACSCLVSYWKGLLRAKKLYSEEEENMSLFALPLFPFLDENRAKFDLSERGMYINNFCSISIHVVAYSTLDHQG